MDQLRNSEDDSMSEPSFIRKIKQDSQSHPAKVAEAAKEGDLPKIRENEDLQPSNKHGECLIKQEPGLKLPQGGRKTLISGKFEGKTRKSLNRRLKRKVNIGLNLT